MTEQIKCPNCGQKIDKNAKYCPQCGVWINPVEKMSKEGQYIAIILFLLFLCLLAIFLLTHPWPYQPDAG